MNQNKIKWTKQSWDHFISNIEGAVRQFQMNSKMKEQWFDDNDFVLDSKLSGETPLDCFSRILEKLSRGILQICSIIYREQ